MNNNNFYNVIRKMAKNDDDMFNFFQKYDSLLNESKHLLSGANNYFGAVQSNDYKFEEMLIEFSKEKKYGTKKETIFKNVEKLTLLYFDGVKDFQDDANEITNLINNKVNELTGLFKKPTMNDKEIFKNLLLKKLQIIDKGIDTLLLLCLVRFSFDGKMTNSAYQTLENEYNFNSDLNILGRATKQIEIKIFVAQILDLF